MDKAGRYILWFMAKDSDQYVLQGIFSDYWLAVQTAKRSHENLQLEGKLYIELFDVFGIMPRGVTEKKTTHSLNLELEELLKAYGQG